MNNVEIKVGGKSYAGWKSVRIEAGIEQISRAFALEVTESFPGNTDFSVFRGGELVQVFIDEDLVCTGYVTSTPMRYDGRSITVQVQGKSRTCDLVECCPVQPGAASSSSSSSSDTWAGVKGKSADTSAAQVKPSGKPATQWKKLPAKRIVAELAAPYGIELKDEAGVGDAIAGHVVNPGESVLDSIQRLITKENLLITDDEAGNLVVTVPSESFTTDALVLGENILSAQVAFDMSQTYSKYIALGQHAGTDTDFGRSAAEDKGVGVDPTVSRFRLKVLKDSGLSSPTTCKNRAAFEAAYRAAAARRLTYVVQGWRQSDGSLWKPNRLVQVDDNFLRLNAAFLITKVVYSLSAQGMTTTLELLDPKGLKPKTTAASAGGSDSAAPGVWTEVK